ncbi:hypothetical protein PP178_08070 [Zeaxanthinibacter sp. PT1]|uniref:hypothetical protein n=1 Tax=Zeaxanthinibacter TaxID=561554 RepID=UPI002349719C|nr:hypothetical protein [Zeaxanthinibacter sp. PT1]MDC6351508.1 hypothetical protein [Zeaxanthinibacter sp. PT1]
MELEELQQVWTELSQEVEKQKKLNHKIIMEMTQQKYRRKFDKITRYETAGTVICILSAGFVLFNFDKLDTFFYQACGIFAIAFLVVLPTSVLLALRKIKAIDLINNPYKDTIVAYTKAKNRLLFLQRIGIFSSFIFFFVTLALTGKIMNDKDVFQETEIWYFIVLVLIGLLFFSRWGYRMYLKITGSAEDLIEDIKP